MSLDFSILNTSSELVLNYNKGDTTVSLTAKLIELDDNEGDITVEITGLYNLEFFGAELAYHVGNPSISGKPVIKFVHNELRRISPVGKKVFIDLA